MGNRFTDLDELMEQVRLEVAAMKTTHPDAKIFSTKNSEKDFVQHLRAIAFLSVENDVFMEQDLINCTTFLSQILRGSVMTPITSDEGGWLDISASSGRPLWQNKRDKRYFSEDGGRTWRIERRSNADGSEYKYCPNCSSGIPLKRDVVKTVFGEMYDCNVCRHLYKESELLANKPEPKENE